MSKKIAISGDDLMRFLFAKIIKEFEEWGSKHGVERPRLDNGHIGFYLEDVEKFWEDR